MKNIFDFFRKIEKLPIEEVEAIEEKVKNKDITYQDVAMQYFELSQIRRNFENSPDGRFCKREGERIKELKRRRGKL